jgi:FkbM family methyltransferase
MKWLTLKKACYALLRPSLWPALRLGTAPSIEHLEALAPHTGIRTVVDIGANRGQFALLSRRLFAQAAVHAFEPLDGPARTFERLFHGDGAIRLHRVAIGKVAGTAEINVMSRDDSSSLLQPSALQSDLFGTAPAGTETISVRRLAEVLDGDAIVRPALLKIDVQGFELDVLQGSSDRLDLFDLILVECSFVELYRAQALATEVVSWLLARGFELRGVFNQHIDPTFGPVQADFLFARP